MTNAFHLLIEKAVIYLLKYLRRHSISIHSKEEESHRAECVNMICIWMKTK